MTYLQHRQSLKLNGKPAPVKKVYKIASQSTKRQKEQRAYVLIVKELMQESDRCELKVEGICTGTSSGLHHQKKRIGFLLDKRYLKRACTACNNFCETNPQDALKLGLNLSKFTK